MPVVKRSVSFDPDIWRAVSRLAEAEDGGRVDVLVTGDVRFRTRVGASYRGVQLLSPRAFLDLLRSPAR